MAVGRQAHSLKLTGDQDRIFDEKFLRRYFYKLCARKAIPAYHDQTFDEKLLIRKAIPGSDI